MYKTKNIAILFVALLSFHQAQANCSVNLIDPVFALEQRRELTRTAVSELSFSYFSFVDNPVGYETIVLMKEARDRGVKVRAIFDPFSSNIPAFVAKYLIDAGVELKYYNPLALKNLTRADRRSHEKLLIVDRKAVIMGGRNLNSAYFDLTFHDKFFFVDHEMIFRGEAADQAQNYFDERWESRWVDKLKLQKLSEANYSTFVDKLNQFRSSLYQKSPQPYLDFKNREAMAVAAEAKLNQLVPDRCEETEFFHPDPDRRKRDFTLEHAFIKLIEESKKSILIMNPYVIPTKSIYRALTEAVRDRGVEVTIITNSMRSNDLPLAHAAYLNDRKFLLRAGVQVYEFYDEKKTLHAKDALFDNEKALIGSFNLDPRSSHLNSEIFMVSSSTEVVQNILDFKESISRFAFKIQPDGFPENYQELGLTRREVIKKKFNRITSKIFRGRL